jgi:PBSX family phage portal protein
MSELGDAGIVEEEAIQVIYTEKNDDLWDAASGVSVSEWESDPFSKGIEGQREFGGLSMGSKRRLTNEIKKVHKGMGTARSKAQYREQISGYDWWDVVPPLYNLEHLALLPEKSTVHHSAVLAKVAAVVSVGYDLIESESTLDRIEEAGLTDNTKELEFIRSKVSRMRSKYLRWLEKVNEEDTFTEVLEKWITDYESLGVGALEIGRTVSGEVGYIGHIPAHTIRPRKDRDGFVQIVDEKVTFFRNFGDRTTVNPIGDDDTPNEIIYLKKYTPRSTYYGIPDIIPALNAVAGIEFAKQYNVDYFENKAVPRYMIVVKGARLSREAEKRIVEFFQQNVKGKHHRAVLIPLPEGNGNAEIEIRPVEADVQDASFERYMNMSRDEILMAHRVPMTKVGLTADINLAVARDADRTFKESVVRPLQDKVETYVNYILNEKTNVVSFNLKELSLVDEETQATIHQVYHTLGAISTNEIRSSIGKKSIEGGDEFINVLDKSQEQAETRSQATDGRARERTERRSGPDAPNSDKGRKPKTSS